MSRYSRSVASTGMVETALAEACAQERAPFLASLEPFRRLSSDDLERVASSVTERLVAAGEAVQVESGLPGSDLFVVREGTLELLHKEVVVAVISRGEVFGHATLLTGLPPEFTTRARQDSTLWCLPKEVARDLLCRPEGLKFVADTLRERLIQAARTMRGIPDVGTRTTGSLARAPVYCAPRTTIREAAQLMSLQRTSVLLVRTSRGLGIVTDFDLRDKVVAGDVPRDAPVSMVMTSPVETVGADEPTREAAIEMMVAGVGYLPVLDDAGQVVGVLSAQSLMASDARSPFALRRRIQQARDEDDLTQAAADLPALFVELLETHRDAPEITGILTAFCDAMTLRSLELAIERRGQPPVAYAWLVFGSGARNELTLASDQDNGLAYDDTDDPAVKEYFRLLAEDVNGSLRRCGFGVDPHGTVAGNWQWRLPLSTWCAVFARALEGRDLDRLARASVAFDFRQLAGDLALAEPLTEIMRAAPEHQRFMSGLAELGTHNPVPLSGLRQRLPERVDVKNDCLRPIQNFARYHALDAKITAHSTLDRLRAAAQSGVLAPDTEQSLREAFTSMLDLQLRHHANAVRAGRPLDNEVDVEALRPLTRVTLQEALRLVAATQRRFPRLPTLR